MKKLYLAYSLHAIFKQILLLFDAIAATFPFWRFHYKVVNCVIGGSDYFLLSVSLRALVTSKVHGSSEVLHFWHFSGFRDLDSFCKLHYIAIGHVHFFINHILNHSKVSNEHKKLDDLKIGQDPGTQFSNSFWFLATHHLE